MRSLDVRKVHSPQNGNKNITEISNGSFSDEQREEGSDLTNSEPRLSFSTKSDGHLEPDFVSLFGNIEVHLQNPVADDGFAKSPAAAPEQNLRKKKSFRKKFVIASVIALPLIAGAFGVFAAVRFFRFARSVSVKDQSFYKAAQQMIGAAIGPNIPVLQNLDQTALAEAIRGQKRVNILLLGYGGSGHSGAYLSDSMMVVSLDFAANKVYMISIPRDLWVKIPTTGSSGGYWKINAAYAFGVDNKHFKKKLPEFTGPAGGGNLAKHAVSEVMGMPMDYFVSLDFEGFRKIIDSLGGVAIEVDNAFTDYTYPSGDEKENGPVCVGSDYFTNCRYKKVHFDKGVQEMDGKRALEYARSRHGSGHEGSDFARSKRQQKLLVSMQKKALQLGIIPKIFELMDDIQGHFKTDLSVAEIKDLQAYIQKVDMQKADHLSLTDSGLVVPSRSQDGQYILNPRKGRDNWNEIHDYIFNALNNTTEDITEVYGPKDPDRNF